MADASIEIVAYADDGSNEFTITDERWNDQIDADEDWGAETNSPPEIWGIDPITDTFKGIRLSQVMGNETVDEGILLRLQRLYTEVIQDGYSIEIITHLQTPEIISAVQSVYAALCGQIHIIKPQIDTIFILGEVPGHKIYLTIIKAIQLEQAVAQPAAIRVSEIKAYTLPEYSTLLGEANATAIRLQHWDYNYLAALSAAAQIDPNLQLYLRDVQLTIDQLTQ